MTSKDGHCNASCGAHADDPLILRSLPAVGRSVLNKPHVRVNDLVERRIKRQTFQVAAHIGSSEISAIARGVVTLRQAQNGISRGFRVRCVGTEDRGGRKSPNEIVGKWCP